MRTEIEQDARIKFNDDKIKLMDKNMSHVFIHLKLYRRYSIIKKDSCKFWNYEINAYLCNAQQTQRRESPQKYVGYFYAHN